MRDDYRMGEDDPVYLDDVEMAAENYEQAKRAESKAYRDRLIRRCYEGGNVTRRDLAAASGLSLSTIDAIRRAGRRPWPRPKLRVVR
jgi:transcriptional regulator with XRE-family HTH domain